MIDVYKNDSITLKQKTIDKYKNVSYVTSTIKARVVRDTKWLKQETGEMVISTIQLYCDSGADIEHTDKITVDGLDHAIVRIEKKQLFSTDNHKLVYLS